MGLWDTAKELGKDVFDKMGEEAEIVRRLKEYSDDKLIEIVNDTGFFSSYSSSERRWAKRILINRGISIN